MKNKINTHKILGEFHDHPDYPAIAKFAGKMSRTHKAHEILTAVNKKYKPLDYLRMRDKHQPLKIFGEVGNHVPYNALEQMQYALSIPPATRGALMPDAHYGYSVPIGAVVELDNAVSPAFVGYDISCMMMLSIFDISPADFMADRKQLAQVLREETAFGIGSAFQTPRKHEVMDDPAWNEAQVIKSFQPLAQKQLGSSGGGNHFADLVIGGTHGSRGEFVALMTHSGSRGTGHKLATHYVKMAENETKFKARKIPRGYGWLDMDKDAGREYWIAMQLMGDYTVANHTLIHEHFAKSAGMGVVENHWNRHNFVWIDDGMYVHRKGATPAGIDVYGIVPGTSGTNSYLTKGLGNPDSLFSSSHGAGRPHSRTQAKKEHKQDEFAEHMKENDILHFGLNTDETYQAYKDIDEVIAVQEGILLETVATLDPKVVIMGGKADDGD